MRTGSKHDIKDERINGGKASDRSRCGRDDAPDRNTRLLQRKIRARASRGVEAEGVFHARELERQDESLPRNRRVADTRGDRKLGARASPNAQRKRTRGVRCSPLRRHGGAQEKRLIKSNPTRNFRRVGFLRCIPTRIRNAQSSLYTRISCPGTAPEQEILLFTSNYRSSANHSNSNAPV